MCGELRGGELRGDLCGGDLACGALDSALTVCIPSACSTLVCVLGEFAHLGGITSSLAGTRLHQPARRASSSAVPSATTPTATIIAMMAPTGTDPDTGGGAGAAGGIDCDDAMSCTTGVAVTERLAGSIAEALAALLRTGARAASTV